MSYRTVLVAAAALALPLSGPAIAAANRVPVTIAVPTADLDLSTARGAATLKNRVAAAINDACTPEISSMHGDLDMTRCRAELRHDASAKLDQRFDEAQPAVRVLGADAAGTN